jgi:hypothetical protein
MPQTWIMKRGFIVASLIAIMLGRLRMSLASCENTYAEFAEAIFSPRRHTLDPRRMTDFLKANGKFDEEPLETLVKQRIGDAGLDEGALLKDDRSDACNVYVLFHTHQSWHGLC